jgi:N-acetyl-gamma-glutamyl-phosphate reductase
LKGKKPVNRGQEKDSSFQNGKTSSNLFNSTPRNSNRGVCFFYQLKLFYFSIMNVTIVGASGYSGRQLVSILAGHPKVNLVGVTSRKYAGTPVESSIPHLRGKVEGVIFTNPGIKELCENTDCDLFFLALPHGTAASYAIPLLNAGKKVIDLSADFRLKTDQCYQEFYGSPHPEPEWLGRATYGLPEIHNFSWEDSSLIASPGCYPTSILIPLFPLLKDGLIEESGIVANSMSGVSGAGRNATEKLLYCERNESAGPYGLPKHRHLSEIEEQLSLASSNDVIISFHPHLAPMNRGICSTISVSAKEGLNRKKVWDSWKSFYRGRKFVHLLDEGEFPDVAHVAGTNRIDLSVNEDKRTGRYTICSAEDNLIKGAGGQAVQSMNICQGYEEGEGLP